MDSNKQHNGSVPIHSSSSGDASVSPSSASGETLDDIALDPSQALSGVAGDAGLSPSRQGGLRFTFRLTPYEYRNMLYFNNFSRQRWQTMFIVLSWLLSFILVMLEQFEVIPPLEKVTHACLLLVSVIFPALLLTTEFAVYRFRKNNPQEFRDIRAVRVTREGVEFSGQGHRKVNFEDWKSFTRAYETKSMFILYRDNRNMSVLPKRSVPEADLQPLRNLLKDNMRQGFFQRAG